jgi:predicted membrane metal-binding protein
MTQCDALFQPPILFAATLALIAVYAHGLPLARPGKESSLGARAALWGVNEIISLVLASLVAGLATTPYAAFHFHRIAPYGVLANLLAMPVVSAWVMPMGILGVVAILAIRRSLKFQPHNSGRTGNAWATWTQTGPNAVCYSAPFDIAAITSTAESSALRVRLA